jgi:hypothetical protein
MNLKSDRARMLLVLIPALAASVLCGLHMYTLSVRREKIKKDYAELNSIRYGLLSVDAWKDRMRLIAGVRIGEFKLSKEHEVLIRGEVSKALNALITEAEAMLQKRPSTFSGKLRKIAIRALVSFKEVRAKVPEFTQTIMDELDRPEHARTLKKFVRGGLNDYASRRYDSPEDLALSGDLLVAYRVHSVEEFNRAAERDLRTLEADIDGDCILLLDGALLFLFAWWLARGKPELHRTLFSLSAAFALILLAVGLALPMIDLDARIKSVDFLLWGAHVQFRDQVLFFRSKSILEVVQVLMSTGKGDSIVVGVLLMLFSVIFPIAKLISMESYMRGGKALRENSLVHFFAFKSGKYSMADVTVVAIFIAYIGFKGILNTQLADLNMKGQYVEIIATNDTALQPGFVLFTAFVLFGFALSAILKRVRGRF